MRTRINNDGGTWDASYRDEFGIECHCAREKTKDEIIHKLLRIIGRKHSHIHGSGNNIQ